MIHRRLMSDHHWFWFVIETAVIWPQSISRMYTRLQQNVTVKHAHNLIFFLYLTDKNLGNVNFFSKTVCGGL